MKKVVPSDINLLESLMRILHIPVASGRQAWGLSQAEKRAGHQSRVVAFDETQFRLSADQILFATSDGILKRELKRWCFFLSSIFKYDVFHFHFGQKFFTLFPRPLKAGDSIFQAFLRLGYWAYSLIVGHLDTFILKALGKKMFMTFHGDDVRQGDRSLELYEFSIAQEVSADYYDAYSDRRKRRMARYYRFFCEQVYVVSPDLLVMADRAKLAHLAGVDPNEWTAREHIAGKPITIVHAPTHRSAKGTRFLENAVKNLKNQDFNFNFELIEQLPNNEARKRYAKADVVVDQLLAGWFGVFAVEMMSMGKPVIAYIRDDDLACESIDFQRELPIIRATPATIEDVLQRCIANPMELEEVGLRSREFVQKWYVPDLVAALIIKDYTSN